MQIKYCTSQPTFLLRKFYIEQMFVLGTVNTVRLNKKSSKLFTNFVNYYNKYKVLSK